MSNIRDTKILFDKTSIHATEYSLKFFSFRHQATIQAVNLHPSDVITFEIVHLESGTPDEWCGCFIRPGDLPHIAGVETLLCYECSGGATPVALTAHNPVVVLNAPQNVILRARYEGQGLGMSQVWATLETDTIEMIPGMDGCLGECMPCIPDPDSWRETGTRRCNITTDKLEALMVNNCGTQEWREVDDLTWQESGNFKCTDTDNDVYTVEVEEVNDCGTTRWEITRAEEWQDTGLVRCNIQDDVVEKQQTTLCGDLRWVEDQDSYWQDTGKTRCENHIVEIEQVNLCGHTRWEASDEHCGFIATLPLPCGGAAFRPGEQPPDATVELEAGCGGATRAEVIGYIYPDPREGADVPVFEGCFGAPCVEGDLIGYAVNKKIPQCGDDLVRVQLTDYVGISKMPPIQVEVLNPIDLAPVLALINTLHGQVTHLTERLAAVENEINNAGCN